MLKDKTLVRLARIFVIGGLIWSIPASADYALNLTKGVTSISRDLYDLHMQILYVVTFIAGVVFLVLIWSIVFHRKSRGFTPAKFHHNTTVEVIWTVIPILILVVMAVPATRSLIHMEDTGDAEITIKITGYQWKWRYEYKNEGIDFFSRLADQSEKLRKLGANQALHEHYLLEVDKPVVVPVRTKIRLLTTAADVIHAWWVPALGWKRDAVPGFINDNWTYIEEPGVYRGQCAELCGRDHAFMPIVVEAVSMEDYLAWVEAQQAIAEQGICATEVCTKDELISAGKAIYNTQCIACHQAEGQGIPGVFVALAGSPIVNGPVAEHIDIVLNGKNIMPAFSSQLSDEELAAVITYERNAWGNETGDVVQASDIRAAR